MKPIVTPLQRGKACLSCRKRKMKCDGLHPTCTQCIKTNREAECVYHDKKQVSRTQLLQQKLAMLEARLRELESPQSSSSSSNPSTPSSSTSSAETSSSMAENVLFSGRVEETTHPSNADWSRDSYPFMSSHSSTPAPEASSPGGSWMKEFLHVPLHFGQLSPLPQRQLVDDFLTASASATSMALTKWWEDSDTFCPDKQLLVHIFLEHRHQCAFSVDIGDFHTSLALASPQGPHPALMDAIYLMGCLFSGTLQYSGLETHFLKRALRGISDALQHSDRVLNVLQASCLLALYFFWRGRVLEGYYHSSTAARLAISLGLHHSKPDNFQGAFAAPTQDLMSTLPHTSDKESMERLAAFWQVFSIDRAWSVATGLPPALPDDDRPAAQIKPTWPSTIYDRLTNAVFNTIQPAHGTGTSWSALRALATLLFERTFRLESGSFKRDTFWIEHQSLEISLLQLAAHLPPTSSAGGSTPFSTVNVDLIAIHTLIHTSTIHLHRQFSFTNAASYKKCIMSADAITSLIRDLSYGDYEFLDPISSTCWKSAADVYIRALLSSHAEALLLSLDAFDQELDTLVMAMKCLGKNFPIAGVHAIKAEHDRTTARAALGML